MRIFVVGNINSGKSYVVDKLRESFKNYKVLKIDDYRIKYSTGSVESENDCRLIFSKDILECNDCIIEFSGGKNITDLFIEKIEYNSFIIIEVIENLDVCLERVNYKDFNKIPYPNYGEKLENTIIKLDKEFKENDLINKSFKDKYLKKYVINSKDKIDVSILRKYEDLIKFIENIKLLSLNKLELISFGSLARGDLKEESDLDLFIKTNEYDKVKDFILSYFQNYDINFFEKDIIVKKNNLVYEFKIISDYNELELFYNKSFIKDINKTVLIGTCETFQNLKLIISNFKDTTLRDIQYSIFRIKHYIQLLDKIICKNDDYRFYFHTNIILHEYIKLSFFINGRSEFLYSPRNALDIIDVNNVEKVIYDFKKDKDEIKENIKKICQEIIDDVLNKLNENGESNG